jgi:hypothetical protein
MFGTLRIIFFASLIFDKLYDFSREVYIKCHLSKINKKVKKLFEEKKQKAFGVLYFIVDNWKDRAVKIVPLVICWVLIFSGEFVYGFFALNTYFQDVNNPNPPLVQGLENIGNGGRLNFPKVTVCPILWAKYNSSITGNFPVSDAVYKATPLSVDSCKSYPNGPYKPFVDCWNNRNSRKVKYNIEGLDRNDPEFNCFDFNLNNEAFVNQYQIDGYMQIRVKSLNRDVTNSTNAVAVYFTDTNDALPVEFAAKSVGWFKLPKFTQNRLSLEKTILEKRNTTSKVTYGPVLSQADDIPSSIIYQGALDELDIILTYRTLETTILRFSYGVDLLKTLGLIGGFFGVLRGVLVVYTIFDLVYILVRECLFQKSIKELHKKVKDFDSKLDEGIEMKSKESLTIKVDSGEDEKKIQFNNKSE